MKISRRQMINKVGLGVGVLASGSLLNGKVLDSQSSSGPRRVIFFMQNQGYVPATVIPEGMTSSGPLITSNGQMTQKTFLLRP